MFGLGVGEILIILAFALIFIGPKKLPGLAKSLGKSLREFQRAKDEILHTMDVNQPHQSHHHSSPPAEGDIEAEVTGVSEIDPDQEDFDDYAHNDDPDEMDQSDEKETKKS